jgi:hypothetical protein
VTAAHDYEDLHRLVDQLTPEQARRLRKHALQLISTDDGDAVPEVAEVPRKLSFIGLIHAESDLAERSEDILREEFGR